jgi:hypothetical protein
MAGDAHPAVGANGPNLPGPRLRVGEVKAGGRNLDRGDVLGESARGVRATQAGGGSGTRQPAAELRDEREPDRIPCRAMEIGASDARRLPWDDERADPHCIAVHDNHEVRDPAAHGVGQGGTIGLAGRQDDQEIGVWPDGDVSSGEQRADSSGHRGGRPVVSDFDTQ